MSIFLPLAAIEVVAVTRRAVSGAHARDQVEPAPRRATDPHPSVRRTRLALPALLVPFGSR
ncbi:MAG TPA: hypothetical protein VNO83_05630 [Pseudonocardia sp.]|nr:hypothetical protein [Pseudonocardia sp.]